MEVLLRPANDSIRPMSTVEIALRIRPVGSGDAHPTRWRLDPQYELWAAKTFPAARFCYCPLNIYDLQVRPADARHTLEDVDAQLRAETLRFGGYAIPGLTRWWPRTTMFAVGGVRLKPLLEFLFAWS